MHEVLVIAFALLRYFPFSGACALDNLTDYRAAGAAGAIQAGAGVPQAVFPETG